MNYRKKDIIAVIPAHNEEKYLAEVIKETEKYVDKIIIVNDGSKDSTKEIAEKARVIIINHSKKLGLGASLRHGCDRALDIGAKIIVNIDADAQHKPSEIKLLVDELYDKHAEAIFGQRDFEKIPLKKRTGNRFLSWLLKKLFDIKIKDTQTGLRVLTSSCYKQIKWNSKDYTVASEILINLHKNNIRYAEIPITTIYHENHKGTTILDGVKIALKILRLKLT
jgi:glycosyltransferase involved in cell wall biosynthesis